MLEGYRLAAPPLLWPEARSAVRQLSWRGDLSVAAGEAAVVVALDSLGVQAEDPPGLGVEAWRLATEFGWARTYDAEYLALARILTCRVVTLDARLRRAADRLGFVVGPAEL